jgi:hypothetical protein
LADSSEQNAGDGKNPSSAQQHAAQLAQHYSPQRCTAWPLPPGSQWLLHGRHVDSTPLRPWSANIRAPPATPDRESTATRPRAPNASRPCGIDRNSSHRTFRHCYRIAWALGRQYLAMEVEGERFEQAQNRSAAESVGPTLGALGGGAPGFRPAMRNALEPNHRGKARPPPGTATTPERAGSRSQTDRRPWLRG